MRKKLGFPLIASLLIAGCATADSSSNKEMAAMNMSHAHMGHVTKAWTDTPDGKGLLVTAQAEAEIAAFHAGLAAKKPDDLAWMKTHTHHVVHALDPSREAKGPGLGYGVVKASTGTVKHINLAAASADASANVKTHSQHVATSAQNTLDRANEMLKLADQVFAATDAKTAAPLVKQIAQLSNQLLAGYDANNDGKITWQKGEGGLNEASRHMGIMSKGENMAAPVSQESMNSSY